MASWLSNHYNGERPTIDRLITLQGGPKHTEECPTQKGTNQAVPVILRIRKRCYSLWYKAYLDYITQVTQPHTCTTGGEPGGAPQD